MSPDLDFNELDKAVSSLASNSNKGAKPTDTSQPATSSNDDSPSPLKPHAGKGRFMDMVHPSADMTSAVTPPKSDSDDGPSVPSVGKTIAPASKDIKPDPVPEKNVDDLPVVKQLSPIEDADPSSLVATPDIAETKKADPLEEATKKERERVARDGAKQRKAEHNLADKKPEEEKDKTEVPEEDSKPDDKLDKDKTENKPLFLEDAKVEKRPLGAFNENAKSDAKENERPALKPKSKEEQDDTQKTTPPPPPPEFNKEVVALEASDENVLTEEKPEKVPDQVKGSNKDNENFSLPPQYKQAIESKNEAAQSSIYEPAAFDAFADNNTPSTTKPWMWVIIFLGIIALGVALSLGTFFVVGAS